VEWWKKKVLEMKSKARDSQILVNKKENEVKDLKVKLNKQDEYLQNLISQRVELEDRFLSKSIYRQGLKEKQENVITDIKELKSELKKEKEAIYELEEKLRIKLVEKITEGVDKKTKEDLSRQALQNEINSLSNLDEMYSMHPVSRNLVSSLSLSNILRLTWKNENPDGSNYYPCLLVFLKTISKFVLAVEEEDDDIVLKLSKFGCQEMNKVLTALAWDEGWVWDWTQLYVLQPRYKCRPDVLFNHFSFDFIIRPEFVSKQSKDQLVQEIKAAGGTVHYVARKIRCTFSTKLDYVRALTCYKLIRYHMIYLHRDNLVQTCGTGENNYYKGSVCLTEFNILSILWMGEEEAGYAECLSVFLQDSRIKEVLLGSNLNLIVTFHDLSAMNTALRDYCQASCNTLELLIRMPVRCKLVSKGGYFSLLCPSTAVKQDLHSYRHMCRMEVEPRRITSMYKLCLVHILRERDIHLKYPEIVFNHTNFLCKDGDTLPRRIRQAELVQPCNSPHYADEDHPLEEDAPPPGDQREVTSDYEESLVSEPTGGEAIV